MKKSVMIDPGHGGVHPGAVDKDLGYKEKDIVLKVAEFMKDELVKNHSDIFVWMTRTEDITLSLQGRCNLADEAGVSVFMSIHTNARCLKGRKGLEIETYHCRGSKTGKRFAKIVQKNLVAENYKGPPTIDRGVKVGKRWSKKKQKWMPFYVLKHTRMPAILVELGFLSDFEEMIILSSPYYQETMGKCLARSLAEFFDKEEDDG